MNKENKVKSTENVLTMESLPRSKWDIFVKVVATIICLILFFANSFFIFKQVISGKTIILSDFNSEEERILFPLIVICNYSAYKNSKFETLSLDEYRRNTLDIEDVLEEVYLGFSDSDNISYLNISTNRSENLRIRPISTYFRGRCYGYQFRKKVTLQTESMISKLVRY